MARRECGLEAERVVSESNIEAIRQRMFPGVGAREKVGTELDVLTVAQSRPLSRALGERELVDVSGDILNQRMIKDPKEIESIKKACCKHLGLLEVTPRPPRPIPKAPSQHTVHHSTI